MTDPKPTVPPSSSAYLLSQQQTQHAAWPVAVARPPTATIVRAVTVTCLAFAVAGVLGAVLWSQLADPPSYEVLRSNAAMGEAEAAREFGVDVTFAAMAMLMALPLGAFVGWRWHRVGWPQVLVCAVSAGIAAVIAWRLGMALGPADPSTVLADAQVGDRIPEQLDVHAKGFLLTWPVGALGGFLLAATFFSRPRRSASKPPGRDVWQDPPIS